MSTQKLSVVKFKLKSKLLLKTNQDSYLTYQSLLGDVLNHSYSRNTRYSDQCQINGLFHVLTACSYAEIQ
jgi:hypothetical protein